MDSRSLYPRLGFQTLRVACAEFVRSRAIRAFPVVLVAVDISAMGTSPDFSSGDIVGRIVTVRGQRLLFDFDLAALYGVTTARLNQQVNRNFERFPSDFIFRLEDQELAVLMLQFATSKQRVERRGGLRKPPRMFTEHGAIMAATVLNSVRAVQMSVYVVRAFVKLREVLASNMDLSRRLETLERSVAARGCQLRGVLNADNGPIYPRLGFGLSCADRPAGIKASRRDR